MSWAVVPAGAKEPVAVYPKWSYKRALEVCASFARAMGVVVDLDEVHMWNRVWVKERTIGHITPDGWLVSAF